MLLIFGCVLFSGWGGLCDRARARKLLTTIATPTRLDVAANSMIRVESADGSKSQLIQHGVFTVIIVIPEGSCVNKQVSSKLLCGHFSSTFEKLSRRQ